MRELASEGTWGCGRSTEQRIRGLESQGRPVGTAVCETAQVQVRSGWSVGFN